jgi:hypothetical protein
MKEGEGRRSRVRAPGTLVGWRVIRLVRSCLKNILCSYKNEMRMSCEGWTTTQVRSCLKTYHVRTHKRNMENVLLQAILYNYVLFFFTGGKQGLIYLCFVSNCWETEKQGGVTRAYTAIYQRLAATGILYNVYIAWWRFGISPRISSSEANSYLTKKFHSHLTLLPKVYI